MSSDIRSQLQGALGAGYVVGTEMPPGGMSRLFLATETALERTVVVKVLPPELSSELSAERFRREMFLTARLRHPHILTVLNAGFANGLLYFVSPYIEGESLRARLVREPKLAVSEVVGIVRELADALSCAHAAGIVHRDVKPENVLLEHGHAVLADFGVARALAQATGGLSLTGTGLGIGTPGYMAPEQLAGEASLDGRADLYALGAIAYEMLAGTPLFDAKTSQQLLAAHLSETPRPLLTRRPDLQRELAALVMRLVAKEPSDRPASAAEVSASLELLSKKEPARTSSRGRIARGGAIAAAVAILLVGYYVVRTGNQPPRAPAVEQGNNSTTQPPIDSLGAMQSKSIAVLPFVNMSDDRENEYFSDGMTEELIDALAKVDGLHVAARTSSFAFKGKSEDVAAIGAKLHVQAVVEGSVRRQGRRLRVTAQLVNAADGYHLWSETYDRELRDVFQVQDEVSRAIVAALRVKLRLANRSDTAIVRIGTNDPEAHDLFLRGRFLWNQRTYKSLVNAQRFFERAIARDSSYAEAYSALAQTFVLLPIYSSAVRPSDAFPKSIAAAEHALALDSTLAASHATLGYASILNDYDWVRADIEFRHALALDPNDATSHDWYATYLNAAGKRDDAEAEVRRAVALDPLSRSINADLASQLVLGRHYDAALRQTSVVLELDPNFATARGLSCYVHTLRREYAVALTECDRALELSGRESTWLGQIAFTYAAAGDTAKATTILEELRALAARRFVAPMPLAYANLGLGRRTEALFWLDSAVSGKDPNLVNYVGDPMLDSLRGDPRYQGILKRMKLP